MEPGRSEARRKNGPAAASPRPHHLPGCNPAASDSGLYRCDICGVSGVEEEGELANLRVCGECWFRIEHWTGG